MNADVKTRWLEALRSGRYYQHEGGLYWNNMYCCLGVLAKVEGVLRDDGCAATVDCQEPAEDGKCGMLSRAFADRVGLSPEEQKTLANLNDDGQSFDLIADYIEAKL